MKNHHTKLKAILSTIIALILAYVIAVIITSDKVLVIGISTIIGHFAIVAIWQWIPAIDDTHAADRINGRGTTNEK